MGCLAQSMHRRRATPPSTRVLVAIAAVVVIGGMVFAKFGQNTGWPWWVYYTVPAAVTLAVPPVTLRFSSHELWQYLILAALSSPCWLSPSNAVL